MAQDRLRENIII